MLDSATSDEVGVVSVEQATDDDLSTSDTSTMSLLANAKGDEQHQQDANATSAHGDGTLGTHTGAIHDADSGSGSGGGTHHTPVPQLSTPDYNGTHFPHPGTVDHQGSDTLDAPTGTFQDADSGGGSGGGTGRIPFAS